MEKFYEIYKSHAGQQVIEMKEDRSFFARILVVCKSRPDINLKESIGKHESSVVPRSLFATDGTMLHCPVKSNLMAILENLPSDEAQVSHQNAECTSIDVRSTSTSNLAEPDVAFAKLEVGLVDAMAIVQSMGQPEWIRNCSQLADHFISCVFQRCNI